MQDRLQLRLMRERWPAIREGTLHFPSPSPPAPSQQAGPPPASEPKDGAASDSERMAWKALRALQSGEGSMLGRAPVRGGAGQEAKAGAAKKEGGKGIRSRSAPRGPTVPVAERQRAPPPKGLTRSHGDEARNHVHQRTGKSGGQRGAQQRMTADEEGAGGRVAVGALAAFAEARRQANAGWLDDEVLQGLDERPAEGPFAWGQKTGSLAKTFGTQRGSTPHGSWARRPPASETAPPSAVHHDGVLPAGWPACREAGAPSWSAAGAAGEPNWRREGHSERPQAPLGGSSPDQGAQAANVFSGGRRNRAWHDTWRSPSSLPNSRPARLRPPSLPGESGRMAPGTPAPLWPRSPTATGAARPPGPLLTPSCPILAPTVQSAAAPLTAGLSETPDTGEGGRWPTPGRLQAGAREAGEAVVRGGVLLGGTTAPAGGAVAAVERDAHHVQNRASGQAGAGDVVEGENGVTAAKQVKDELAEAVKRQLGPLYKRKVIGERHGQPARATLVSTCCLLLNMLKILYR